MIVRDRDSTLQTAGNILEAVIAYGWDLGLSSSRDLTVTTTVSDAADRAVLSAKIIKLCSIRSLERLNADTPQQFPLPHHHCYRRSHLRHP